MCTLCIITYGIYLLFLKKICMYNGRCLSVMRSGDKREIRRTIIFFWNSWFNIYPVSWLIGIGSSGFPITIVLLIVITLLSFIKRPRHPRLFLLLRHNMAILTNYQAVLTRKFGFYLTSAIGIVRLLIIGSRVQIRQGLLLILNFI